ncbi:MAG: hypothetical protein ACRDF4_07865 [Rhabdochlamydiaceae bacterium]
MSDSDHMQHEHDTSAASSRAAASAAGGNDTNHIPVTLTHLNQLYSQFSQLQQETMQNVHQIQVSLHDIQSQTHHTHNTDTGSLPASHIIIVPIPGQIKLPKPSLYTGAVRTNVETWLFEVEQYLVAYACNIDSQRIAVATGSMKGLALQWWRSECMTNPGLVISWEEFKERVRRRFQPVAASRTARANLRSLKQGNKTVAEYCGMYYEQIQVINDMSEADKIENFMYGLQQGLFSDVDRRDPQTLQDAMTYAQRAELRSRVRAQYGVNHLRNKFSYPTTTHTPTASTTPTTASIPMELGRVEMNEEKEEMEEAYEQYLNEMDEEECLAELEELQLEEEAEVEQEEKKVEPTQLQAITTRINNKNSRLTKEELIRLRREGRCFRCKRKDHISRDCPFANNPQRRNGGNQPSKY